MAGRHTNAKANKNGDVLVSQTTTDSPLLPVGQIEKLYQIDPAKAQWVFEQTEIEAAQRRSELKRINTMVFVEKLLSLLAALIVVILAFGVATYLAMHNHDGVAMVVAGGGLAYIVSAFLSKNNSK